MESDRVLELLEAANWPEIILQLTYFASIQFRRYGWRAGLPKGNSPDDIALNAIKKVWEGTRDWDPDEYPDLLKHLKWIVRSDVEHLFSSLEHKTTGRIPVLKKDNGTEVELGESVVGNPHSIRDRILTPEEELIAEYDRVSEQTMISKLNDAVKGDEDLELLLLCFEDGIDKPENIANETGWDIQKIYNLKRKLLRRAAKIGKNSMRGKEE